MQKAGRKERKQRNQKKKKKGRNSLKGQGPVNTPEGQGSIPRWGTNIPQALQWGQKRKK